VDRAADFESAGGGSTPPGAIIQPLRGLASLPLAFVSTAIPTSAPHRHGRREHSHSHSGAHRHLLAPWRSAPIPASHEPSQGHTHADGEHAHDGHGHSHGLVDRSILRSRAGLKAVALSLVVLGLTAAAQAVIFVLTGSVALLADLIHNVGDALTAVPLGVAFALRSERAEGYAGLAVVLAIFISACVAGYEAIVRIIEPEAPEHLVALALAGVIGFLGNTAAAFIRTRAGRRLHSPALVADGNHARADAYVSLGVVLSAVVVALGFDVADPLIALAITAVILRITWQSWHTIRHGISHA
jgi:Co/Zn/Cd efflux system component